MLVHRWVTPSIKFAGTHLYTWVERGTVRVECFAQEHNTRRLLRYSELLKMRKTQVAIVEVSIEREIGILITATRRAK